MTRWRAPRDRPRSAISAPDQRSAWGTPSRPAIRSATSTCWASTVEVTAPVSGIVSGVLVEAGQAVEYGQALAEIEALPGPLDGQVGAAPDDAAEDVPTNGSDR